MDTNKLELAEEEYTYSTPKKQWYTCVIRSLMYGILDT